MFYAVRSIENQPVNRILDNWPECKDLVWGKSAVYKSFIDEEAAASFIKNAPVRTEEFGHGYIPTEVGRTIVFGKYLFDRFPEQTNGYSVRVYENSKKERITCRGYYLPTNNRLVYAFTGQFINDKKYGYEFDVESFTEHIVNTKDSIITYLSSGVIKGIGEKKAIAIYEKFGQKTLEVLDKTPEKLLYVKGISRKTLEDIISSYNDNKGARPVTQYLLPFGISPKMAMAVYKQYKIRAVEKIKENPYLICNISGLTFEDADRIAREESFPLDSIIRFKACAFHVLKNHEQTGSTGMEINAFGVEVYNALCSDVTTKDFVNSKTIELIKEKYLRIVRLGKKQYIFTCSAYMREREITNDILRLRHEAIDENPAFVYDAVKEAQKALHLKLDAMQEQACIDALLNRIIVITGGPGTGKTTVIKVINYAYQLLYPKNDRIFLAPTGRAARVITENTGEEAYTAHSYLRIYEDLSPMEDDVIIKNSLVVVDEFSMIDVYVAERLFSSIRENNIFVIVGDADQLKSVGPGNILEDIISSKAVKTIRLVKVFRQNENMKIYTNAQNIKNGVPIIECGDDFHFTETASMEDVKNAMAEQYIAYVKKYGLMNVMCLCPYKKHTAGVIEMNKLLQEKLNPYDEDMIEVHANGEKFRVGDIVMHHLRNTENAANGDIGIIVDIDNTNDSPVITVEINQHEVTYSGESIKMLQLAYAISVHKSQGSEAKAIVTCLTSFHKEMTYRNIPYVAISRGKKEVSFYGELEILYDAIKQVNLQKRVSLLNYFLLYECGEFVAA